MRVYRVLRQVYGLTIDQAQPGLMWDKGLVWMGEYLGIDPEETADAIAHHGNCSR